MEAIINKLHSQAISSESGEVEQSSFLQQVGTDLEHVLDIYILTFSLIILLKLKYGKIFTSNSYFNESDTTS